ncbi:pilus assembly FimT family protein [Halofilum ochraceum]|uniref:pilus assembly FimT family protein n=1 Tax=Halofilum ochraceum TaxID=1611323 RepID=UPI0008D93692|nr:prepilin-type N-terminal cleavage/methylation domain-containing protein [Halofilum ochraceum]
MRAVRGFSLIELVTVLVLIGALAVFAVPRLNTGGFAGYSFHEELLAVVRHAQKTATASRCEVEVTVDKNNDSYAIVFTGAGPDGCPPADTPLIAPGRGGNLAGNAPSRVNINQGAQFIFDGFGVPKSTTPPPEITMTTTIEIDNRRRIEIEAFTGYVHD